MSKPRNISTIEQSDLISIGELVQLSGFRYSTLKYYTEIGILPFIQEEERLNRKYVKIEALKRLEEINFLKVEKRFTIKEIVDYFRSNL
jgi:DNA-binding transcriptional MerR regulator